MPRDLEQEKPVQLTESPNSNMSSPPELHSNQELVKIDLLQIQDEYPADMALHPYTRPLTINDVDSCVALENAAFVTEEERCNREKFIYRLTRCGELALGLFCTATPDSNMAAETLSTGRLVETSRKNMAVSVLLAHIVSTKSHEDTVTDNAMDYPKDWETSLANKTMGHQEDGRTICLHSLGVLPGYQKRGIGRTLLTSYMQQMNGAGIADRIALLAHEDMIPYYEKFGFENHGKSSAEFGGGDWYDMTYNLKAVEPRTAYG